jgi:RNA polymerase sigma-70 factor (ECF subfamily)
VVTTVERVFRDQWGRVLAAMVGYLGDLDLAEDVVQEAFAIAAERWPRDGDPVHPTAWLVTTARNRAINRVRRDRTLAAKAHLLCDPPPPMHPGHDDGGGGHDGHAEEGAPIPDERLELMFLCCHPALALDAQVALTLRALGGLTTAEIARAFLVPEPTMAQRIVRAKRKIAAACIPFRVPREDLLVERVAAVLAVVYLILCGGLSAGGTSVASAPATARRRSGPLTRQIRVVLGRTADTGCRGPGRRPSRPADSDSSPASRATPAPSHTCQGRSGS